MPDLYLIEAFRGPIPEKRSDRIAGLHTFRSFRVFLTLAPNLGHSLRRFSK